MVQISGKYKLVENKNIYEFLLGVGMPEDKAKEANEIKGTLEVTVDGNKITMENDNPKYVTNLVAGQETEELWDGTAIKSTATISGDTISVTSKTSEGEHRGTRKFVFSDGGLEVTFTDGKSHEATRIYKRV